MSSKTQATMPRSDADLQAIQTSVAFKNISDAVEQYRRQFGLAFLALVAFSAIHVGLVVIANLYTMQTRVEHGVLTAAGGEQAAPVGTAASNQVYDLAYIMTNMQETDQVSALENMKTASFVDKAGNYRQYTVTGFQLGGWKRSELKLFTSVGHVLEYVRGKGIRVFSEAGNTTERLNEPVHNSLRHLLGGKGRGKGPPTEPPTASPTAPTTPAPTSSPTYATWTNYKAGLTKAADNMETAASNGGVTARKTVYVVDFLDTDVSSVVMEGGTSDVDSMLSATGLDSIAATSATAETIEEGIGYVDAFVGSFIPAAKTELNKMYTGTDTWNTTTSTWTDMVETAFASPGAIDASLVNTYMSAAVETGLSAGLDTANYMDEIATGGLKAEYEKMYSEWYANGFTVAPTTPTTLYPTSTFVLEGMAHVIESSLVAAAVEDGTFDSLMMPNYKKSASSIAAEAGGWDALAYGEITAMLTTIEASVSSLSDGFSTYKATGWLGSTTASTATSSVDTSKYACTGMTTATLEGYNTDLQSEAEAACAEAGNHIIGGYFFSHILGTFEAFLAHVPNEYCTEVGDLFTVAPTSGDGGGGRHRNLLASEWDNMAKQQMHMVYMLHGWGDTADWLLALSPFVATLQTGCTASGTYVANPITTAADHNQPCVDAKFLLVCPEDGASPFGGKTWYRNNMFTGFHMDMIVYELPWHMASELMISPITKNVFGFSMGAFGTVSIQMTYSSGITASAAFNAPVDAIGCFYANVCHLECGVSSLMCELLWTSIESALNPYVLVKSGHAFQTTGFYDPVAIGNAEAALKGTGTLAPEITDRPTAACLTGAGTAASMYGPGTYSSGVRSAVSNGGVGSMVWTGGYGEFANSVDQGVMGDFHQSSTCTTVCPGAPLDPNSGLPVGDSCAYSCMSMTRRDTPWSGVAYFWLDPVYFTMSSSHFAPTHNPLTGAMSTDITKYTYYTDANANAVTYWASYFNQLPYQRLYQNLDIFREETTAYSDGQQTNAIYMFLGCDSNDEFGLASIMNEFMTVLNMLPDSTISSTGIKGAWIYESSEAHGHSFTETDCKLALQWFTETAMNGRSCVTPPTRRRNLLAMRDESCNSDIKNGPVTEAGYDTASRAVCWLRSDEMVIQGIGGHLTYEGYGGTTAKCGTHVGAWYDPDGLSADVQIQESWITKAIFMSAAGYEDEMEGVSVPSAVSGMKTCVMSGYTDSICPSK